MHAKPSVIAESGRCPFRDLPNAEVDAIEALYIAGATNERRSKYLSN